VSVHPQSGEDLDLYVLGGLDDDERQPLEEHFRSCAQCRHELDAAWGRVSLLALAAPPVVPAAVVRERLLGQIRPRQVTPAEPRFRLVWQWAAAALGLILVFSLHHLYTLREQNRLLSEQVVELKVVRRQQETEARRARAVLDLLSSSDTVKVALASAGAPIVPQGKAFYHPSKGLVFYYAANLPALPSNQRYQLWLVPGRGNPISAGVFDIDAKGNGSVVLPSLPSGLTAKAFAVTIEPWGGVPQPTGKKVLIGLVS
jgi:anti-sigma-K factor RskA